MTEGTLPARLVRAEADQGRSVFLSYDRVFAIVRALAADAAVWGPDLVVGVMRGGIIPATMLAQLLKLPVGFMEYSRREQVPRLAGADVSGRRVLLVDDFVGTGRSLDACRTHLQEHGATVRTFALHFEPGLAPDRRPDHGLPAPGYVLSPWDRRDVSPGTRAISAATKGRYAFSQEQECFGTDLDGVLIRDLPAGRYDRASCRETPGSRRDGYGPNAPVPPLPDAGAFVVTGRPEAERVATRAWLDRHGFAHLELVCRDPRRYGHTARDVARMKVDALRDRGVTVFFEGDLFQSVLIAAALPHVDVIWWGPEDRWQITASPPRLKA